MVVASLLVVSEQAEADLIAIAAYIAERDGITMVRIIDGRRNLPAIFGKKNR